MFTPKVNPLFIAIVLFAVLTIAFVFCGPVIVKALHMASDTLQTVATALK